MRYLSVNPANPHNYFNFLVDANGDARFLSPGGRGQGEGEARKLINYFFLGLTLPDSAFWVNLQPNQGDRITSDELSVTDLGKILLEQDLKLKKDVANYLNPRNPVGKEFWEKLYEQVSLRDPQGRSNLNKLNIQTNNRVWIVPEKAVVVEVADGALVAEAKLKVMLEAEYFEHLRGGGGSSEVGKVKTKNLIDSYINSNKTTGLESKVPWEKDAIYQQYLKSYTQGEYKIKEKIAGLKRMYFSGGIFVGFNGQSGSSPLTVIGKEEVSKLLKEDPQYLNNLSDSSAFKNGMVLTAEQPKNSDNTNQLPWAENINLVSNNLNLTEGGTPVQQAGQETLKVENSKKASSSPLISIYSFLTKVIVGIRWLFYKIKKDDRDQIDYFSGKELFISKKKAGDTGKDLEKLTDEYTKILVEIKKQEAQIKKIEEDLIEVSEGLEEARSQNDKVVADVLALGVGRLEFKLIKGEDRFNRLKLRKKKLEERKEAVKAEHEAGGLNLPDSYVNFVLWQADYLRAVRKEDTMRQDYLKGLDKLNIAKALDLLSKLKFLGHGTVGFLNTEVNHDREISATDVDFVGAVSLLKIILRGKIVDSSISEFVSGRQNYFKYNANYYGPFFVILRPGAKKSDLGKFSELDAHGDRFYSIGSEFHYIYLVPRDVDKIFFIRVIERAAKEGIISKDKAKSAIAKLKTVDELLEELKLSNLMSVYKNSNKNFKDLLILYRSYFEHYRSQPIEDIFRGKLPYDGSRATWFNATRKIIAETHKKIVVYYPGAGYDLMYPLSATNGDVFIFVDKYMKRGDYSGFKKAIFSSIAKHGGRVLKSNIEKDAYYLKFQIFGKIRELYYYYGIDASNEKQLPAIVKKGYDVYMESLLASSSYNGFSYVEDFDNLWKTNFKYMSPEGFVITDYSYMPKGALYQVGYTKHGRNLYFNIYLPDLYLGRSLVMPQPAVGNSGGIDLGNSNIEVVLNDEKFVAGLAPADLKILRAAKALKQGWNSLAVLYLHEVMLMLKYDLIQDMGQRPVALQIMQQLKSANNLDMRALQFFHLLRSHKTFPEFRASVKRYWTKNTYLELKSVRI